MQTRTPGPWAWVQIDGDYWKLIAEDGTVVATDGSAGGEYGAWFADGNTPDANAHLMAVAPKLLEALKYFVASQYQVDTRIDSRGHAWCESYLDEALDNARKVIFAADNP